MGGATGPDNGGNAAPVWTTSKRWKWTALFPLLPLTRLNWLILRMGSESPPRQPPWGLTGPRFFESATELLNVNASCLVAILPKTHQHLIGIEQWLRFIVHEFSMARPSPLGWILN